MLLMYPAVAPFGGPEIQDGSPVKNHPPFAIRRSSLAFGGKGIRPSLLAAEILRCADGAQVLRVGAATQLPFSEAVARLGK